MGKIISKVEDVVVTRQSPVRLIEEALYTAHMLACGIFGIDEDGHSDRVKKWVRSECSLKVEFKGIKLSSGIGGQTHIVTFKAWCEKHED